MMSALTQKSYRDLRRRPARTVFTVTTIALAVAGLWIFAMPVLMDRAMNDRIAADRLHDVRLATSDIELTPEQIAELRRVPGVTALDTRTLYEAEITDGERRRDVLLVGIADWSDQTVNVVSVDDGATPRGNEALTDRMNSRSGRYTGSIGDAVKIADRQGVSHALTVSGRGDTLLFSQIIAENEAVLYVPQATANRLAGASGINSIEFRVQDPGNADRIAAAVRTRLRALAPGVTFPNLADVREAGTWPGEEMFNNFSALLYVGAVLALLSALVLISNTMTTMVAEQTREIAVMKAIGGRRRQIRRSFLRSALVIGLLGTALGIAIGIPFANLMLSVIGRTFFGITPSWGAPMNAAVISVVVGIGATMLASLPALRRAARTSVSDGFSAGLGGSHDSVFDRALRRIRLPRTTQIGLRNVTRRRTRSITTILQITLAVSVASGFIALGVTVAEVTASTWDTMRWDVIVAQRANAPLDDTAARLIATTSGVAQADPILYNFLEVDGRRYESWGFPPDSTQYRPHLADGRWLRPADEAGLRRVAVMGAALARSNGISVGDRVTVGTARGKTRLEIVGIDRNLGNNGTTLFLPLATFQDLLGRTDTNAYWVLSDSQAEPAIDRLATAMSDKLTAAGYPVTTQIHFVERAANLDSNRVLVSVLAAIGIPIALIGLVGLMNTMTMNVIERTRDIGILRCIGASSRSVRRIFRSEALAVALVGAVLAAPGGWLVGALMSWLVTELFDFGSVPYTFPIAAALVALAVTVLLAVVVIVPPLRRASKLQPGNALRYE